MKNLLAFNTWLNRTLIVSLLSLVSTSSYVTYIKYFYVATQPFEIYVEEEEIEQILKDYEKLGKREKSIDEKEYFSKNEISVYDINFYGERRKRFAIKYLLDGYMKVYLHYDTPVYTNYADDAYFFDVYSFGISYEIQPNQNYDGEIRFNSHGISKLIEEGKWIGKYEGLELD